MFGPGVPELLVILFPLGVPELLVILLIIVVIFGASKLPQLGRGFGEGIKNFRKGLKDDSDGESPNANSANSS